MAELRHDRRLAMYCFAWDEGGNEKKKLKYQEKIARIFTRSYGWADEECEVYRDVSPEGEWLPRPEYERLKRDVYDGKIELVWALSVSRLHPFGVGREGFAVLCRSRKVRVIFGILGDEGTTFVGLEDAG